MAGSNGTITVEELKKLLEEWNLVIGFLFLTWICLLQFAYANRNRFLYIIKLIFLWLLWPVTLTCFVLAAVYRINWITGGIAIAMACLVGLMWLSYFIASFRLFARTRSMWSFNPETNILLNVPLHGTILTRPLLESELVIGAVILFLGNKPTNFRSLVDLFSKRTLKSVWLSLGCMLSALTQYN